MNIEILEACVVSFTFLIISLFKCSTGFAILEMLKISVVIWVLTPCSVVGG
jgi:hypothetical protein